MRRRIGASIVAAAVAIGAIAKRAEDEAEAKRREEMRVVAKPRRLSKKKRFT